MLVRVFMILFGFIVVMARGQEKMHVVLVVQEGWHTGIVMKTSDLPSSLFGQFKDYTSRKYIDVSWGDEKYYQHPNPGVFLTVRAVLWPTQAVIRLDAFSRKPTRYYGSSNIMEIRMDSIRFTALCRFISNSFERGEEGEIVPSTFYEDYEDFFLAKRKYSLFRTCNTWVVLAFKKSGYDVHTFMAATAGQMFRRLDKLENSKFLQKQD